MSAGGAEFQRRPIFCGGAFGNILCSRSAKMVYHPGLSRIVTENLNEKSFPKIASLRSGAAVHSVRCVLCSTSSRAERSRGQAASQKTKETKIQEQKIDFEWTPPQAQGKARLKAISFSSPERRQQNQEPHLHRAPASVRTSGSSQEPSEEKTKTGNLAAPRFSAFLFAVAALFSASDGTHRVRGVKLAICLLSPVESSSPPCFLAYKSLVRLCRAFGKSALADSASVETAATNSIFVIFCERSRRKMNHRTYFTKRPSRS
jgi:hypothetical protein